jgi:NitT/TauT family transport system substrate-binding protein
MVQKIVGKPALTHSGKTVAVILMLSVFAAFLGNVAAAEPPPKEIVYRLKWLKNISAVGDLYAKDLGFFDAAGLQVTLNAGGPERDAIKELELGYAQFGVASGDQVVRALAKGSPVVVIAQIFQINPLQWIYHEDEPVIEKLHALKGKTIGVTFGGNDEAIMRTLLAEAGLTEKDVRFFSVRYDYTPFYRRRVTFWPVYQNSQAIILGEKLSASGKGVRFLDPARFGVRFTANSVITSRQMLLAHSDTVKRFITALMTGWAEALKPANSAKALKRVHPFDRDTPEPVLEKQLAVTRALVQPDPRLPIGAIDVAAWRQTAQIMHAQGLIKHPVDIQSALYPFGTPFNGKEKN